MLIINQKGKLLELRAEFAIHDESGHQVAVVRGRWASTWIQVLDMDGRQIFDLRRESSVLSSRVTVGSTSGSRIGRIVQSVSWGELDRSFKLEGPGKEPIGAVYLVDRRRHRDFNIQDATGNVIATVTKTRAGIAKELLTKADNYVLSFVSPTSEQLRAMSVAAVLVIDARFHQQ